MVKGSQRGDEEHTSYKYTRSRPSVSQGVYLSIRTYISTYVRTDEQTDGWTDDHTHNSSCITNYSILLAKKLQ
jgi:hypothetical protein